MSDADVDRLSIGSYIARSVSPLPVVDEVSAFLYIETSRLPHDQVLTCVLLYAPSPSPSHLRFIILVWLDQPRSSLSSRPTGRAASLKALGLEDDVPV